MLRSKRPIRTNHLHIALDNGCVVIHNKDMEATATNTKETSMKTIEIVGFWATISFPFNEKYVKAIKRIPGREWDATRKVWRAPAKNVDAIDDFAGAFGFHITHQATDTSLMTAAEIAADTYWASI